MKNTKSGNGAADRKKGQTKTESHRSFWYYHRTEQKKKDANTEELNWSEGGGRGRAFSGVKMKWELKAL